MSTICEMSSVVWAAGSSVSGVMRWPPSGVAMLRPGRRLLLLAAARPAPDERKAGQRQQSDHALP